MAARVDSVADPMWGSVTTCGSATSGDSSVPIGSRS